MVWLFITLFFLLYIVALMAPAIIVWQEVRKDAAMFKQWAREDEEFNRRTGRINNHRVQRKPDGLENMRSATRG